MSVCDDAVLNLKKEVCVCLKSVYVHCIDITVYISPKEKKAQCTLLHCFGQTGVRMDFFKGMHCCACYLNHNGMKIIFSLYCCDVGLKRSRKECMFEKVWVDLILGCLIESSV